MHDVILASNNDHQFKRIKNKTPIQKKKIQLKDTLHSSNTVHCNKHRYSAWFEKEITNNMEHAQCTSQKGLEKWELDIKAAHPHTAKFPLASAERVAPSADRLSQLTRRNTASAHYITPSQRFPPPTFYLLSFWP